MSDKIFLKKQESHEESKLIADWSAHWQIVRLEEVGVELDTIHCSPCVGTQLDQPVKSYQSIHFTSMKNTHCLLNQSIHCSIDGAIQFQHMKSQIEAKTDLDQVDGSNESANQCNSTEPAHWSAQAVELVVDQGDCIVQYQEMKFEIKAMKLKLNETKEKAMMDIGRAQAEVEHLKVLLELEQCTNNEMKGQLDSQAKQLVENNILQLNLENAQEELRISKTVLKLKELGASRKITRGSDDTAETCGES